VVSPPGLPWRLQAKSDFVLQIHFQSTGRPESIKPRLGLYFTDKPATNQLFKLALDNYAIDIPAGETNYVIEESWVVPQPFEMLALIPHAHRTGKTLETFATLPGGRREDLLTIRNWDFNWQTDYRFVKPPQFPAGTRLSMRYRYDNSTNNAQNPNNPPQRIRYGPQGKDEMGSVTFQVLTRDEPTLKKLSEAYVVLMRDDVIAYARWRLSQDPEDAAGHTLMAKTSMHLGDRVSARASLGRALKSAPRDPEALYLSGVLHRLDRQIDLAVQDFEAVLKAWPDHPKAHGNLGQIYFERGRNSRAEFHLREALKLDPEDMIARETLDQLRPKR
jgi:tetratricopeptide (TPR) repeat protein